MSKALSVKELFDKNVDYDKHFHVHDGPSFDNLRELLAYLPKMTDEQFHHHVDSKKNDFAKWIEDVHGPGEITKLLRSITTRKELIEAITKKARESEQPPKEVPPKKSAQPEKKEVKKETPVEETEVSQEGRPKGKIVEEAEFDKVKEGYATTNESIHDKFDKISDEMKEALEDDMPDELVKEIDELNEKFDETKQRTSELRKLGKDTLIASLMLQQFRAKLAMATATRGTKDFDACRDLLKQVQKELDDAEKAEEVNVKKEVLALAGATKNVEQKG